MLQYPTKYNTTQCIQLKLLYYFTHTVNWNGTEAFTHAYLYSE